MPNPNTVGNPNSSTGTGGNVLARVTAPTGSTGSAPTVELELAKTTGRDPTVELELAKTTGRDLLSVNAGGENMLWGEPSEGGVTQQGLRLIFDMSS